MRIFLDLTKHFPKYYLLCFIKSLKQAIKHAEEENDFDNLERVQLFHNIFVFLWGLDDKNVNTKKKIAIKKSSGKNNNQNIIEKNLRIGKNRESNLVKSIKEIINLEENPPRKSLFKFKNTRDSAEFNEKNISSL